MCINFLKMEVKQKYTCNTADIRQRVHIFPLSKYQKIIWIKFFLEIKQ